MSSPAQENAEQYSDSRKLAARARLNREYTIAEAPWFPWVARQLSLKAGDRVLDIGCGPGWFWAASESVLPERLNLTLVDMSAGMVSEAVERSKSLRFASVEGQQADAMALPFDDGAFDVVVAMHMLYHVPDAAVAIADMFRVLKPGGLLAVTTNGADNMRELYALTTAFGGAPSEPVAALFGYDAAERMMRAQFGNVAYSDYPATLRITDPEGVFLALTSYPPGDRASEGQQRAFRDAIREAFARGNGVLESRKQTGLFLSRKQKAA